MLYWNISKHNFALKIALLSMHPFFIVYLWLMGIQSWYDLGGFVWPILDAERTFITTLPEKGGALLEGHFYCWTSKNSIPIFILLNWIPPLAFCGACSDLLSCRTIWNFHFILYCLKTMCRIWHCLLIFLWIKCVISSTIKFLLKF